MNMQDQKVTDQLLARHENARHEHTFCVSENAGPEIARILKRALA